MDISNKDVEEGAARREENRKTTEDVRGHRKGALVC